MDKDIEYSFWFWADKLPSIMAVLSHLTDYKLDPDELETIRQELRGTNDEKNQWSMHKLDGKKHKMVLTFAYDAEDGPDMIHIKIKTSADLKPKLDGLADIQTC